MLAQLYACQSESDGDRQAHSDILEVALFGQIFTTSSSEQMLQIALGCLRHVHMSSSTFAEELRFSVDSSIASAA